MAVFFSTANPKKSWPLPAVRAATAHAHASRKTQPLHPRPLGPRQQSDLPSAHNAADRGAFAPTPVAPATFDACLRPRQRPPPSPFLSTSLSSTFLILLTTPMTTSPSDDFITGQGAGWRAGYLAGVMAERRRAGGGGDGSNAPGGLVPVETSEPLLQTPGFSTGKTMMELLSSFASRRAALHPGSPLLGSLMGDWSGLFEAEVLSQMDPTSRAVLAQVNRAGRDAVRLPANLACAGRTVGVPLKLGDFVGSAGRLAWAQANRCPWVALTCCLVAQGGHLEALQWALEHGCPWAPETCWFAALGGHLDVVEWLIATTGAHVDYASPGTSGTTLVYVAAEMGHVDMLGWLIGAGADVNTVAANTAGATPLLVAIGNGHVHVVELLLAAPGVNVNLAFTGTCATPLSVAAQDGQTDVVGLLLAAPGVDVNLARISGATPLFFAAGKGHLRVVEQLIAAPGVDVNQARRNGATPLSIALARGHVDVAQKLRAAGATEPHG